MLGYLTPSNNNNENNNENISNVGIHMLTVTSRKNGNSNIGLRIHSGVIPWKKPVVKIGATS